MIIRSVSRLFLVIVVGAMVAGGAASRADEFPDTVQTVLEKADQIELLSLDPWVGKDKVTDGFHGTQILGKTVIKDAKTRKKLVAALMNGVKEKKEEVITAAFYPRHAIRATKGKTTVDLLIAFDDSVIMVYVGKDMAPSAPDVFTTASAQPVLDQILRDAKVPLARQPGKK